MTTKKLMATLGALFVCTGALADVSTTADYITETSLDFEQPMTYTEGWTKSGSHISYTSATRTVGTEKNRFLELTADTIAPAANYCESAA